MTIETFKEYAKTRQALDSEEIRRFMDEMSNEARRVTFRLNASFHTADEVRGLLSDLFGYRVPPSLRVFPPFYTDFGKNIAVGDEVFINACCHFQDHGGVTQHRSRQLPVRRELSFLARPRLRHRPMLLRCRRPFRPVVFRPPENDRYADRRSQDVPRDA